MTTEDRDTALADRVTAARTAPVQARSAARLETLLDAAAAIVDETGYERLTTAMVAERAEASIGTVYRYYPDRLALLQALSARSFSRFVAAVLDELGSGSHRTWLDAVDAAIDLFTVMFRTEPGFRAIRFGDALDVGPTDPERSSNARLASVIAEELAGRYALADRQGLVFALEVAVEMIDALLYRAFSANAAGDQRFIDEARVVTHDYLVRHIPLAA